MRTLRKSASKGSGKVALSAGSENRYLIFAHKQEAPVATPLTNATSLTRCSQFQGITADMFFDLETYANANANEKRIAADA